VPRLVNIVCIRSEIHSDWTCKVLTPKLLGEALPTAPAVSTESIGVRVASLIIEDFPNELRRGDQPLSLVLLRIHILKEVEQVCCSDACEIGLRIRSHENRERDEHPRQVHALKLQSEHEGHFPLRLWVHTRPVVNDPHDQRGATKENLEEHSNAIQHECCKKQEEKVVALPLRIDELLQWCAVLVEEQ